MLEASVSKHFLASLRTSKERNHTDAVCTNVSNKLGHPRVSAERTTGNILKMGSGLETVVAHDAFDSRELDRPSKVIGIRSDL